MNKKNILNFIALFAIFLFFGCLSAGTPPNKEQQNKTNLSADAKDLYLSALLTGKGLDKYTYYYEEDRNGYIVKVKIFKNNASAKVIEDIPLSTRTAYFLNNSTILCIKVLGENESCAYTENATNVNDYMDRLKSYLFDDKKMLKETEDKSFIINRGFLSFGNISEKQTQLGNCNDIRLVINYSTATIEESGRLGLGPGAPLYISGSFCVNKDTKQAYEKYFKYKLGDQEVYTKFTLLDYDFNSAPYILPPANVSERLLASPLIQIEKQKLSEAISCYRSLTKEETEMCLYSYSIYNKNIGACVYTGQKSDRCMLNVAVAKKNQTDCKTIGSQDYKDDCYIEIAGLLKDSSLCSNIANQTRTLQCKNLATNNQTVVKPSTKDVDDSAIQVATFNLTKAREQQQRLIDNISESN